MQRIEIYLSLKSSCKLECHFFIQLKILCNDETLTYSQVLNLNSQVYLEVWTFNHKQNNKFTTQQP